MDTPGSSQPRKWKRDPEKNKLNQKQYRQRIKASKDGLEWVRAQNRRRYYERVDKLKADGEYDAFKAKKSKEGMRRYHAYSEEKRHDIRRKNRCFNKRWTQRMKDEGTYEEYKDRLNERRRALVRQKKEAMGAEAYNLLQQQKYRRRVDGQRRQRWQWVDDQLNRPFPLTWLPLDWEEVKPIEDPVQTVCANALLNMDHLL